MKNCERCGKNIENDCVFCPTCYKITRKKQTIRNTNWLRAKVTKRQRKLS